MVPFGLIAGAMAGILVAVLWADDGDETWPLGAFIVGSLAASYLRGMAIAAWDERHGQQHS
ncbi:hypothetical protein GCM10017688_07540 [Streptomyces ramulosus]